MMQTSGLASSPTPSTRNPAENSFSEKPAHSADKFGDLMQRALSGTNNEPTDSESTSAADDLKADRKRTPAKKSDDNSTAQYNGFAGAPAATPLPAPNQPNGSAHDSSEAKGTAVPVPPDLGKPEVKDADNTETETAEKSAEKAAGTQETQTTAEGSQSAPTGTAPALAAQTSEANSPAASLAQAMIAAKSDAQTEQITLPKAPTNALAVSPLDARGTSAAKQDMTMKKAEKTPKVAGQAEQDLPGISTLSSEELPKGQKLSTKDEFHASDKSEIAGMDLPVRVLTSNDSPAPTVTAATDTSFPTIDARTLERTHDIVALHAMRLNDTNSDTLHVVVKPGAGIQISLELRQSARGIEVHAALHKGDFDQLNQHWPELQQRLEARGVRVGTLTTAENFTSSGHQQFQQSKQQSPNQDPLYAGAFAEFALAGSITEAPAARAARATAYRGWETWA